MNRSSLLQCLAAMYPRAIANASSQVMDGVGKAATGAAKLTAKAAWSLGKFASSR